MPLLEIRGENGTTPLIAAALAGDVREVRSLLERGANVKARDNFHRTPLIAAAANWSGCDPDLVKLLLDHGADVNAQNRGGWTALAEAVWKGYVDVVALLLSRGASVGIRAKDGRSALGMAQACCASRQGMNDSHSP